MAAYFRLKDGLEKSSFFPDEKPITKEKTKPKPIKKVSEKRVPLQDRYNVMKLEYFSKKEKCSVKGCKKIGSTVEHTKGRKGYADKWAIENEIPLLIDIRHWIKVCPQHNLEFESNTALSREYQKSKNHDQAKGFLKENLVNILLPNGETHEVEIRGEYFVAKNNYTKWKITNKIKIV